MKIENIKPVVVLVAICLVVAALLAGVNILTKDDIEDAESQKVFDSLREVIDGTFEVKEIPEAAPSTVTGLYKVTDGEAIVGHAVTLKVKGYAGDIFMTVGIDADGKVTKVVITSQSESHGKAGMATYTDKFNGVGADNVADVDLFTGATISSTAIKGAVIDALNTVLGGNISAPEEEEKEETPITSPREEEELLSLAEELVPGAADFEDVTPEYNKPETLVRLYEETSGKGYVAYVITKGAYVPIANEALLYIDVNGEISNINHLTWVVGHGVTADGFAEKFLGKDYWNVDGVELVATATGTSADLRDAIKTALDVVTKLIPRTDYKLAELMDKLVPNSQGFEKTELADGAPETLRAVYREKSGLGYVAHIITAGEYVEVATESLVYFDTERNIKDLNILVWNVGHGVEPGSFADGFVGKNAETIGDVEIVTAATGTSGDLRAAVEAAIPYVPSDFPVARVVGIIAAVAILLFVGLSVVYVTKRRKNR